MECKDGLCTLPAKKGRWFKPWPFAFIIVPIVAIVGQCISWNQKISWVIPLTLLITSFRAENLLAWEYFAPVDTSIIFDSIPALEISAEGELVKFIEGLFKNTTALEKWGTYDYLPAVLGNFTIPIVRNAVVGTLQDDRELVSFETAYHDMYKSNYSKQYLFFPVKSRYTFNGSEAGSAEKLEASCNDISVQDLDLKRIWNGFGTKAHKTFVGSQFVIGKSIAPPSKEATGTDWHCAIGNNWFVQVAGKKTWQFVEPKYSAYLAPLKGGIYNMWTGRHNMAELQKHIPTRQTVLEPGDLLYNPDWAWHKITNFEGLSIGIPIRERNLTLSFQNNPYFTSIVVLTKLLQPLGLSLGGFPPPSKSTEHDN